MQQSAAFKILKTRLKAVPAYSFNGEQLKKTSSGAPYQFLHHMSGGSHITEDGDVAVDNGNSHNAINFATRIKQFQEMQQQHREHFRTQAQIRRKVIPVSKVTTDFLILHKK